MQQNEKRKQTFESVQYGLEISFKFKKRELKQRRRRRRERRRERRLVKNEFIFYKRRSRLSRSVRYADGSKNVFKLNMQRRRSIPNRDTKN